MSLILHLVRKDFRRAWVLFGIWCPILILSVVLDTKAELFLDGRGPAQNVGTPSSAELEFAVLVFFWPASNLPRPSHASRYCLEAGA